jgi:putative SOS response-associated peptidase YedK
MCGRITQKGNPKVLGLKIAMLVEPLFEAPPRYNGAPSQQHWVICQHSESGTRTLDWLIWGLILRRGLMTAGCRRLSLTRATCCSPSRPS